MNDFVTKDSGKRQEYNSGMRRDTQEGKPDFYLILAKGLSFSQHMLTRWAALMERGVHKYGRRNWEKADSEEELERFKSSAFRHFVQWVSDADDGEDHAAAVFFNINAAEYVKTRLSSKRSTPQTGDPELEAWLKNYE